MASRGQKRTRTTIRRRVEATIDGERGVFMISVAAELAEMHPQTLRMYESRGLITPKRSPKNTRLYSQSDVERLRRIQQMTSDEGLNLAGVETVLKMEEQVDRLRGELEKVRRRAEALEHELTEKVEQVRRSLRAEIVPYGAYDVIPTEEGPVSIPVERKPSKGGGSAK